MLLKMVSVIYILLPDVANIIIKFITHPGATNMMRKLGILIFSVNLNYFLSFWVQIFNKSILLSDGHVNKMSFVELT